MKMTTIVNASLAIAILGAGCALNQVQVAAGVDSFQLPGVGGKQIELKDIKINAGRTVQSLQAKDNAAAFALEVSREYNGTSGITSSVSTVRALKKRGLFPGTVVSDDSLVIFISSTGSFDDSKHLFGQSAKVTHYTRLVGMFDPASGEILAYGLLP